jgi:four helix bundle protein
LKKNIGDQVIKSADSVGANIAEGYGRYHRKDQINFLCYSSGSLYETKNWIELLHRRILINDQKKNEILQTLEHTTKKLNAYINYKKKY